MERIFNEAANKGGIYRIRNKVNGTPYIGSAKCFKVRINQHERSLRNDKHSNPRLRNAFKKYGEDVFVFEVLEIINGKSIKKRRIIEQRYIDEVWPNCYNVRKDTIKKQGPWSSTPEETKRKKSEAAKGRKQTPETKKKISEGNIGKKRSQEQCKRNSEAHKGKIGFWAGKKRTDDTKNKLSKARKGKKHSEETRRKMSLTKKGDKHPLYGKHHTEEAKQKMSKAKMGKKPSKETKEKMSKAHGGPNNHFYGKVHTEKTKEKISKMLKGRKSWNKGKPGYKNKSCSEETKKKIGEAQKGEKNHMYGKIPWNKGKKLLKPAWNKRKINQYDLEMNFIKTWGSIKEAVKELKLSQGNITMVAQNKRNHCGGFIWKYFEDIKQNHNDLL